MSGPRSLRPTWAEVDLAAIEHNVRLLNESTGDSKFCAVVKADGYGHGAEQIAKAALAGGATWLAVALVEEGVALRDAGIEVPILVLSEPSRDAMYEVVARGLTPALYTRDRIEALAEARNALSAQPHPFHLKVDTGMHRAGCDPEHAAELVAYARSLDSVEVEGIWTHFACADEPSHPSNGAQSAAFDEVIERMGPSLPPMIHAANSAATLVFPEQRRSMVRVGIAMYGVAPSGEVPLPAGIRPTISIKSQVSFVRDLQAGERISYGHRYQLVRPGRIATVPIGYADGIPRLASLRGAEALIGGRRLPIAGSVTMDQLMVDCGDHPVEPGDEVVLLGTQGGEAITAEGWAELSDTIAYEIVTGIGPRLPRRYLTAEPGQNYA